LTSGAANHLPQPVSHPLAFKTCRRGRRVSTTDGPDPTALTATVPSISQPLFHLRNEAKKGDWSVWKIDASKIRNIRGGGVEREYGASPPGCLAHRRRDWSGGPAGLGAPRGRLTVRSRSVFGFVLGRIRWSVRDFVVDERDASGRGCLGGAAISRRTCWVVPAVDESHLDQIWAKSGSKNLCACVSACCLGVNEGFGWVR
jgi:hypothetical protein